MTLTTLIEQVKAADAKATTAPWIPDDMGDSPYVWNKEQDLLVAKTWHDHEQTGAANRDLIAFYRNVTPALVEMLEGALKALRDIADGNDQFDPAYAATVLDRINAMAAKVLGSERR